MSINTIIKNLPEKSGIYKMLDNKNSVIYVGKASNLKKRVSSYFTKSSPVSYTHLRAHET